MQTLYLVGYAVLGAAVGAAASWSYSTGGTSRMWLTIAAASGVLLMLGVWDWQRQVSQETPLLSYILAAVLPPIVVAMAVHALAHRGASPRTQVLVSVVAFWIASIVAVVAGAAVNAG